jgi:hypothetical protein
MSLEEERLRQIREILLNHKGKQNAIASSKIAKMLGIPENDTVATTRSLITKLIKNSYLPIGSSENGYYIMQTEEELNEVMQDLNGRILGIYDRINKLISNFNECNGKYVKHVEPRDDDEL